MHWKVISFYKKKNYENCKNYKSIVLYDYMIKRSSQNKCDTDVNKYKYCKIEKYRRSSYQ
jgi:hypothetical protein